MMTILSKLENLINCWTGASKTGEQRKLSLDTKVLKESIEKMAQGGLKDLEKGLSIVKRKGTIARLLLSYY